MNKLIIDGIEYELLEIAFDTFMLATYPEIETLASNMEVSPTNDAIIMKRYDSLKINGKYWAYKKKETK